MPIQTTSTWHALDAREALDELTSDPEVGLTVDEAAERLQRWGPNAFPEPPRRTGLQRVVGQLRSPLIYLLAGAAVLAAVLGHLSDAVVIAIVVVLNAVVGAFQEGRAERALEALRRLTGSQAHVVRGGVPVVIDARDVVAGDLLRLAAGDAVAADARIIDGAALQIAEAALTGESMPVSKDQVPVAPDTALADRRCMVFAGTHVTAGRARAVVVATGHRTELGHIALLAETTRAPATPLERRIERLGRALLGAALVAFVLVMAVGLIRGVAAGQIAIVAISQVVGLVPEGLPAAMTIALAVGVQRMARRGAIVRRLAAVETLGTTTVICTDKTGTLTRNEMTAVELWLPGRGAIAVTGTGYAPVGELRQDGQVVTVDDAGLENLLRAAVLCNDAQLIGPDTSSPDWRGVGDPTEVALLTAAVKAGLVPTELRRSMPRRAELPFDAATKLMATQHDAGDASLVVLKGAPEVVLELCGELDDDARHEIQRVVAAMADRALRVLAIAVVNGGCIDGSAGTAAFRGNAVLLGLVGQLDPPRPEVRAAIARCRSAGIRPVMITGDHQGTAVAIARDLGIVAAGDRALDGRELEALSDAALAAQLDRVSVFARVHPAQKLRIVAAYQARGDVVAMTGDGVNDAPALVRADVGVAMGRAGTDIAKEAAAIVVTDDNFATIAAAVDEGRVVYGNIKKAVLFLMATSAAEVLILLAAMALGYPPPFAAVQILWNNLVTEGVITVNLVMERAEGDEMQRPPTRADEPLFTRDMIRRLAIMTPSIVAVTLGWFAWRTSTGVPAIVAQSEAFTLLVVCEWFNVLSCRSSHASALRPDLVRNRWLIGGLLVGNLLQVAVIFHPLLNRVFHTTPFGLEQVVAIGLAGSLVLIPEELRKWRVRRAARVREPDRADIIATRLGEPDA